MEKSHLRFSTNILRRLGEELNQSIDQGILELVKNSYDADAIHCKVELSKIDKPGGQITVSDDGVGMDDDAIDNGWLVLGKSSKSIHVPTQLGRIPSGNKGLGRLAALRMGTSTRLISRPKHEPDAQYEININWDLYDNTEVVEDIDLEIVRSMHSRNLTHGTSIEIQGVRSSIGRSEVKKLARGLLLLADPFGDNPEGFQPILVAPEFREYERLVRNRYFNQAQYHLTAKLDKDGYSHAVATDWKGDKLYEAEHKDIFNKKSSKAGSTKYESPDANFDLWVFILDTKNFSVTNVTLSEVKEWLTEFGGVHLYMRGLRVTPYGDPGNDWLELNLKRVRSPEFLPSTNTSIGRITVVDPEEMFLQKTDRSGIVENESFQQLKQFAQDSIAWLQKRRLAEREQKRVKERTSAPKEVGLAKSSLGTAIKELPAGTRKKVEKAVSNYEKAREREVKALQNEVQLYRTLGTVGIASAAFAHETRQPLIAIKRNASLIGRHIKELPASEYHDLFSKSVDKITQQSSILQKFASLTLGLINHEKRRIGRVDIHSVIKNVVELFSYIFEDRKINVEVQLAQGNPYIRASEAALESVIANLLTNSIRAFEGYIGDPKILITTSYLTESNLVIRVLDSGRGIEGISLKDIWLPGQTTYDNGTGLGLTIVHDTVGDLGGSVDALSKSVLGGAELIIELPILGS
jgi:signal transduction histidine kinase